MIPLATLRALHPDTNGGDHSRVAELQRVIEEHRRHNKYCACGCGQKICPARLKTRPKTRYAGLQCSNRHRQRRKPRKLATALALLALVFSVHAQNSAAWTNAMIAAKANVIYMTTVMPMIHLGWSIPTNYLAANYESLIIHSYNASMPLDQWPVEFDCMGCTNCLLPATNPAEYWCAKAGPRTK